MEGGKQYDVALVTTIARSNERVPPFASLDIEAYCRSKGVRAAIIDEKSEIGRPITEEVWKAMFRRIAERIERSDARIVGLGCFTPEAPEVLQTCRLLKRRLPGLRLVVGGIHPTIKPDDFIFPDSPVDAVVIGEGERTFAELAIALRDGRPLDEIRGIAFLKDGRMRETPRMPVMHDLDEIPPRDFSLIDMEFYCKPQMDLIRPLYLSTYYIFTTRGCPSVCTFCVSKNLFKKNEALLGMARVRSIGAVVDEIELLKRKYRIDAFMIADETFTLGKKRVFEFCDELERRRLGMVWACQTKANLLTEEMVAAMAKAGCIQLEFGVEAGSQEMLNRMKKGVRIDQIRNCFAWSKKHGIRTFANFMFNCPGETEKDVEDTLRLAEELDADTYSFGILTPFPGTDLHDERRIDLPMEEYYLYNIAKLALTDRRFIFATHGHNLEELTNGTNARLNPLRRRISYLWDPRYLRAILRSRRKTDYLVGAILPLKKFMIKVWREVTGRRAKVSRARIDYLKITDV
ncbi:radical SAM protein [Candidatus Woesearchaeota archaeon]|nr:radical SAM protein [Candidatus Woesearchaeota archaeon]